MTASSIMEEKLSVSITDMETWEKSKRFTVYKILVESPRTSWFVFKRYNEFCALYDKLKKLYPSAKLKLPGKKFFGNMDPVFIQQRKEGLTDFIRKIIVNQKIYKDDEVQSFFNLANKSDPIGRSLKFEAPKILQASSLEKTVKIPTEPVNLGPSERPSARPSDFEFLKTIGRGSFGKVFVAKYKSDEKIYAVKVLSKEHILRRNEVKHIMSERNVLLKNVKHPFLVGLHFSFQTKDKLYFVLDYVNGGELFFHLQKDRTFSEKRVQFYGAEISSALGYLHSLDIIYRDLKPENILLDYQGHVLLTDFGLCKENIKKANKTSTFCGTPEYLAPEVLKKHPYDKTVDWWCLGAVLYEMLHGLPPFFNRDTRILYENILHKPLRISTKISPAARQLLEGLLQKDHTRRLGAVSDFDEVSAEPFFSDIDWDRLLDRSITPPYNPQVSGQLDLRNFDPEFVTEPVPASVGKSVNPCHVMSESVQAVNDAAFAGFSYVPEDVLSK